MNGIARFILFPLWITRRLADGGPQAHGGGVKIRKVVYDTPNGM